MPQNQFQRFVFAFITVVITVHAFVLYNLYVINGEILMQTNQTTSVLEAINRQGGVYMFGHFLPIWSVIITEFIFAYLLELLMGSPLSFHLASRKFDPRRNHPMIFESAIITATVCIMCPTMSFIAAIIYYPYYEEFNIVSLLCHWFKLICFNLPFAYFSQMFFIQPFVRFSFRTLFANDIAKRNTENAQKTIKPIDETEAIADVIIRENEIKEGI